MKYNLASMVGRRTGTHALVPVIEPPIGLEKSILAQLRRIEHEMARAFREIILPAYQRKITVDAGEEDFERVRLLLNALVRSVSGQVSQLLGLEGKRHTKAWMNSARQAFSVDLSAVVKEEDLEAYLEAAALRNAGLIRGMTDDLIKRVQQETTTALIGGESASKLKERIRKQLGISDSRARLIARDQTSKLTSDMNRIRHQQAGLDSYIWRTSKDERVRPRHIKEEGKQYKYGEPTGAEEGLPPGQPIQCRCVAQAVVEFGGSPVNSTSKPAPINPGAYVMEAGKDGAEHMRVVEGGEVLFDHSSGNAHSVVIPADKYRILSDPSKKLDVHHNHPIDGVSFSPSDILFMARTPGVQSFWAHTQSVVFKVERTSKTGQINAKLIDRLTKQYNSKLVDAFTSGKLSIIDIENQRPHFITKELDRLKYVKYTQTGALPQAAKNVEKLL